MIRSANDFSLAELLALAADGRSRHVLSEDSVRAEIKAFPAGHGVTFRSDGCVVLIVLSGTARADLSGESLVLGQLSQLVLNPNREVTLVGSEACVIEFIWIPPFQTVDWSLFEEATAPGK